MVTQLFCFRKWLAEKIVNRISFNDVNKPRKIFFQDDTVSQKKYEETFYKKTNLNFNFKLGKLELKLIISKVRNIYAVRIAFSFNDFDIASSGFIELHP